MRRKKNKRFKKSNLSGKFSPLFSYKKASGVEQLFGSKTRIKLLQLFLNNPNQPYYLRQLSRELKIQLNSIRGEINNLEKIGLIHCVSLFQKKSKEGNKLLKIFSNKKYYLVDIDFPLFPELKALLVKSQILLERKLISQIQTISNLRYFILTGIFVGLENFHTDILLVGSINKFFLKKIIKNFEKDLNRSINYTIMNYKEFKYRQDITDKFLYDILENKKIVIVDRINQ